MKKSEIILSLLVFCTFFVIGCLKVGQDRSNESHSGISSSHLKEEKNIRSQVGQLHRSYDLRFYIVKTAPFAYKLRVDGDVDINKLVEDLESFELDGEKYLGILTKEDKKSSFNRKLNEKLKAIRNFLDFHSTDSSFFISKTPGEKCPDISGAYSKNGQDNSEDIIIIKSQGCQKFEVSRNQKKKGPIIKLGELENCNIGEGYKLCYLGRQMASKHIEFVFLEKWEHENCSKKNWVQVDEKGGSLISKVMQTCNGVNMTNSANSHRFFKVGAMN